VASFNEILTGTAEDLVKVFYIYEQDTQEDKELKLITISKIIELKPAQLTCAVGFNRYIQDLTELLPIIGFENIDDLTQMRNDIFVNDVYRILSLENILSIYGAIKDDQDILQVMQYLLESRLENIETRIEKTVNATLIEKYKAEIRAVYLDNIADIDFAEKRLSKTDCGFRALLNEVGIIADSKILPAGDIFFRDTILPEEKRKLLNKGMIPIELIESRMEDENISKQEKKVLRDYLQLNRKKNGKDNN
jgi:hypothetical protein